MTAPLFTPATREQSRLRLGLIGPSGSGKTYTALAVGSVVAKAAGGKMAFIDTERGSGSKYAGLFSFDQLQLQQFDPRKYVEAIHAAEAAGYRVLVIDSLSHAWMGAGGTLELVDQAAKRSQSGNSFAAWRDVTPIHNQLVDAILGCECHVIATMRAKTEWVLERDERTGKNAPRKIGMAPVQRDGMEYEFDVVGDMDQENNLIITKTRCPDINGKVINKPGAEFAGVLLAWLGQGEAPAANPTSRAAAKREEFSDAVRMAESEDHDGRAMRGEVQSGAKSTGTPALLPLGAESSSAPAPKPVAPPVSEAKPITSDQRAAIVSLCRELSMEAEFPPTFDGAAEQIRKLGAKVTEMKRSARSH